MKKLYSVLFMLAIVAVSYGQTFIVEDFDSNQMPPPGWTIDGYPAQWSVSETTNAGGTAPEGKFTYTSGTSITRFISPVTDLTGYTSVALGFNHYYDYYGNPAPKLGVATRSQGGEWNVAWEITPTDNVGPERLLFLIDNEDVGQADFQFCFYLEGNFYNMNYWYVDNIQLYIPFNLDAFLNSITTPSYIDQPSQVKGLLSNVGVEVLTSVDVNWKVGEGEVNTTSFTGLSLEFGDSFEYVCDQLFDFPIGAYELEVWITNVNGGQDENEENNYLMKTINVASSSDARKPLFEEFTSSTCAPCATFNSSFVPWCTTHEDDITLVKYQMDWPGAGDPYYTLEGGERRGYYGVTWVPWLVGDGGFVDTQMGAVNSFYDSSLETPSFASTVSSYSVNGTEVTYTTTVLPYANLTNYRVHLVVFENLTTGNVGTNGETSFEHVMMKMIPDADGFDEDFEDLVPVTYTGTVDIAGTNVEEWDDLGMAVIVQDYSSKFVQQSAYSVLDGEFSAVAELDDIMIDGTPLEDFDPGTLEYTVWLPEETEIVPVVTATAVSELGKVVIVPATELPGSTKIYTYAQDLSTYFIYTVNFSLAVGVENPKEQSVRVYPNPSNGQMNIDGAIGANVNVIDMTGKRVGNYEQLTTGKIDVSNLSNGIYFLNITFADQTTAVKKFTILK